MFLIGIIQQSPEADIEAKEWFYYADHRESGGQLCDYLMHPTFPTRIFFNPFSLHKTHRMRFETNGQVPYGYEMTIQMLREGADENMKIGFPVNRNEFGQLQTREWILWMCSSRICPLLGEWMQLFV